MKLRTLAERWKAFLSVLLDPWNALLLLVTLALFAASAYESAANKLTSALLFVLVTVAAAMLGARVTQQWSAATEQSIVQARGVAAVRSLKLLLRNIAALESRVRDFRANEAHIADHREVTKRNFEEIRAACIVLQEEAVSSIENWTDIVEEADVRTQIGVITTLKADLDAKANELEGAKADLVRAEGRSSEEKRRLQAHIEQVQSRVTQLQRELLEKSIGFGGGIVTTGTSTLASIFGNPNRPPFISPDAPKGVIEISTGVPGDAKIEITTPTPKK